MLIEEYKDRLVPQNHPVAIEIKSVASKLLAASNLGTVKDGPLLVRQGSSPEGSEQSWNPDADLKWGDSIDSSDSSSEGSKGKEWTVLVVHDTNTVNAFVNYRELFVVVRFLFGKLVPSRLRLSMSM
jgi:metalloendopeptidase OMA1, mitochondrial